MQGLVKFFIKLIMSVFNHKGFFANDFDWLSIQSTHPADCKPLVCDAMQQEATMVSCY